MKNLKLTFLLTCMVFFGFSQNPIIPGYFADPSIKNFNGKYYIYATTDGYGPFGNDGQPLVWVSDDLVQWKPEKLEGFPNETIWAPAVIKGKDNKYYVFCQNSIDYSGYVYKGDSPTGPFKKVSHLGGFDLEPFLDPVSGKIFGISATKQLLEMNNDIDSPDYLTKVVKTIPLQGELFDFTEGPYMFYKNGFYYLMWAGGRCWQRSYNIKYAVSKNIEGPYKSIGKGIILATDEKQNVLGPGHNSIIELNGRYFTFYHRQDPDAVNPCASRFSCVSEVVFNKDGAVEFKQLVDDLPKTLGIKSKMINYALNAETFANTEGLKHRAVYATDGKNDTRWTTEVNQQGQLSINLGQERAIKQIEVDFEYPDKWHTFKLEYSNDNQNWTTIVDHTQQAVQAYPNMFTDVDIKAKFIKLSINNSEDRTASVWEVKVYGNP
ncbi:MAG: family 43 glycosylhydrolase [Oligoflexus sp.]|nr:family 43 glycosylhydrolase [Pseudopedobacter sp.]